MYSKHGAHLTKSAIILFIMIANSRSAPLMNDGDEETQPIRAPEQEVINEELQLKSLPKHQEMNEYALVGKPQVARPVPSEGKIQEAVSEVEISEPSSNNLDLTPKAVAEYLYLTGDFMGFENAIDDLLASGMVLPKEATLYKESVGEELAAIKKTFTPDRSMNDVENSLSNQKHDPSNLSKADQKLVPVMDITGEKPWVQGGFQEQNHEDKTSNIPVSDELKSNEEDINELLKEESVLNQMLQMVLNDFIIKTMLKFNKESVGMASNSKVNQDLDNLIAIFQDKDKISSGEPGADDEKENKPLAENIKVQQKQNNAPMPVPTTKVDQSAEKLGREIAQQMMS